MGFGDDRDILMAQLHEQRTRWHIWVALISGIMTGYGLLMGLYLGFG